METLNALVKEDDSEQLSTFFTSRPGFSLQTKDIDGNTLFHLCCAYGATKCLSILLERHDSKTVINEINFSDKATPLYTAAMFDETEIALALLKAGADQKIPTHEGRLPIHEAAFHCNTKMITALISFLEVENYDTKTDVLSTVINYGDKYKCTPLHCAAISNSGNKEAILLLLSNGANPTIQDMNFKTPAFYAAIFNFFMTTLFLNYEKCDDGKVMISIYDAKSKMSKIKINHVLPFAFGAPKLLRIECPDESVVSKSQTDDTVSDETSISTCKSHSLLVSSVSVNLNDHNENKNIPQKASKEESSKKKTKKSKRKKNKEKKIGNSHTLNEINEVRDDVYDKASLNLNDEKCIIENENIENNDETLVVEKENNDIHEEKCIVEKNVKEEKDDLKEEKDDLKKEKNNIEREIKEANFDNKEEMSSIETNDKEEKNDVKETYNTIEKNDKEENSSIKEEMRTVKKIDKEEKVNKEENGDDKDENNSIKKNSKEMRAIESDIKEENEIFIKKNHSVLNDRKDKDLSATSDNLLSRSTIAPAKRRNVRIYTLREKTRPTIIDHSQTRKKTFNEIAVDFSPSLVQKDEDYSLLLTTSDEKYATQWDNALNNWDSFKRSKILKYASRGVPHKSREKFWQLCLESNPANSMEIRKNYYQELSSMTNNPNNIKLSKNLFQIDADLKRLNPKLTFFTKRFGKGQIMLFNVLRCYVLHDPLHEYVQGMADICAVLALINTSEIALFWSFCQLMGDMKWNLRNMFLPQFPGVAKCIQIQNSALRKFNKPLYKHFTKTNFIVKNSTSCSLHFCYGLEWYMTLWTRVLPYEIIFHIFDLILFEGTFPTVINVALTLFHLMQTTLLKETEPSLIAALLKNLNERFESMSPNKFLACLKICRRTKEEIESLYVEKKKNSKKNLKAVSSEKSSPKV